MGGWAARGVSRPCQGTELPGALVLCPAQSLTDQEAHKNLGARWWTDRAIPYGQDKGAKAGGRLLSPLSPSFPGPSHQAHPRVEVEMPQGLPLPKEEPESSQSEPLPSAKQHKKAKKRKSLGAPVLPAMTSTVSAPSETLGLEREWQLLGLPFSSCLMEL